jgi:potassium-dependent mechanosensitive channel
MRITALARKAGKNPTGPFLCRNCSAPESVRLNKAKFWAFLYAALVISSTQFLTWAPGVVLAQEAAGGKSTPPTTSSSSANHVSDRLSAAQAELKRLDGPEGIAAGAPPDSTPEELDERRALLQALIAWYEWQLDRVDMLTDLKEHGTEIGIVLDSGPSFPSSPPYSYLLVDELRQKERLLAVAMKTAQAGRAIAIQEKERAQEEVGEWQGKARQLAEQEEIVKAPERLSRIKWERELVRLHEQVAGARLGTLDLLRQYNEEESRLLAQKSAVVTQAIARMAPDAVFSKQEFERIRDNLENEGRINQAKMAPAVKASAQALSALEQAREAAQNARNQTGNGTGSNDLKQLDRRVQIERVHADNAAYRVNAISLSAQMLNLRQDVWRRRWLMNTSPDPDAMRKALAAIDQIRSTTAALRAQAELQLELANKQRSAVKPGTMDARQADEAQESMDLASAYDARAEISRQTLHAIDIADNLVDRWADEIRERRDGDGTRRLSYLAGSVLHAARELWNFELIAVEDTIEVEGQTITGKRSVTVNKVVTAILIFVLGSWFSGWLLRKIQGLVIHRFGKDKSQVELIRKWAYSSVVILLAAIALLWVKIPFTVFAFLGGAIAIGAGFGMQTLLKNLISGLMLLIERPFKLGDLVEVAGMRGRVMDIGVRSSVVRSVDGIETLIPNSVFLEQNVTNWTYSSQKVRFSLVVNVAYGSDVRKTCDTLIEAALRHPDILREPPPSVLLNDFGNDALVFNLNFWLEMRTEIDSYAVRSDLRFMIEKALGDLGIVLAFPQRDVHLDTARPLQVEVVSPSSSNREPKPK